MTMTPIEKAESTLAYLRGSDGKLTEKQCVKFIDLVTDTTEESRARWDSARWHFKAWWRVKARVRGWFGLVTRMPYHVNAICWTRANKNDDDV